MTVRIESNEKQNYDKVSQWRTDIFIELMTKVHSKIKRSERVSRVLIFTILFIKRFTSSLGTFDERYFRTVALAGFSYSGLLRSLAV